MVLNAPQGGAADATGALSSPSVANPTPNNVDVCPVLARCHEHVDRNCVSVMGDFTVDMPSVGAEFGAPAAPATRPPRGLAFTDGVSRTLVRRCRFSGEMEGITCIVLDT